MSLEDAKVQAARAFLQKRGYTVLNPLIHVSQVMVHLGVSRAHISNLWHIDPTFPKPLEIGVNQSVKRREFRFYAHEIEAWIKSREVKDVNDQSVRPES